MNISIRALQLTDMAQIARIANQAFLEGGRFTSRFGTLVVDFLQELPGWHHVAISGDEVVGFIICMKQANSPAPTIAWIATHPAWQGKGVGRKLLDVYEQLLKDNGHTKVLVGTPFAQRFYLDNGYTATGATWSMVRELVGKSIEAPLNVTVHGIDLENIAALTDSMDESRRADFVRSLMQVYEKEQDKSFYVELDGKITGLIVGETDPFQYDLARTLFLSYEDLDALKSLLDTFAYICSKNGKRWAGFAPDNDKTKTAAESWDWQEAHMPSWHVVYKFEKNI